VSDSAPLIAVGYMMIGSLAPVVPPPQPVSRIEVRLVAGDTFKVVRHSDDDKRHEHRRHSEHNHAPGTVVVASTNGHNLIAMPDLLEYTRDAASDRLCESLRSYYVTSERPVIFNSFIRATRPASVGDLSRP
jgi:hypothetical protein